MVSAYLLRPTRSRQEYLEQLMREERAKPAHYREWIAMGKAPFREARKPRPLLRGTSAIGAGYVIGLNERDRRIAEGTARTLSGIADMLKGQRHD